MAQFKCANSKCTTKNPEELMFLNTDSKKDAMKERCADCFETYLRRNGMSEYYHLIEVDVPDPITQEEPDGQVECG